MHLLSVVDGRVSELHGFLSVLVPSSIDLVTHNLVRSVGSISVLFEILGPFLSDFNVGLIGLNVAVNDFLCVVLVDVSPLTVGSRWFGEGRLGLLVFHGVNVLIHDIVSFNEVLSGFLFEMVCNSSVSDFVLVNSFINFSIELKSVLEISVDVSLHSSSSVVVVFVGLNGGEEGGNHKCRLFHFGLVKKFNLKI